MPRSALFRRLVWLACSLVCYLLCHGRLSSGIRLRTLRTPRRTTSRVGQASRSRATRAAASAPKISPHLPPPPSPPYPRPGPLTKRALPTYSCFKLGHTAVACGTIGASADVCDVGIVAGGGKEAGTARRSNTPSLHLCAGASAAIFCFFVSFKYIVNWYQSEYSMEPVMLYVLHYSTPIL